MKLTWSKEDNIMDREVPKSASTMKIQEMSTEFEVNGTPTKISVRRHKDYRSIFTIVHDKKVIKEGSMRSVNLSNCLLEVVRANKYLCYYNPIMAWSTYEFAKALVDIRLHPSGDGSWEVRIRYNDGDATTKNYPANMAQGDVMNSLISELGIPNRNETSKK